MIKIPKTLLYRLPGVGSVLRRGSNAKTAFRFFFFAVCYLLLPLVLLHARILPSIYTVIAFHLVNSIVFAVLFYFYSGYKQKVALKLLDIDEAINITNNHTAQAFKANSACQEKIKRYGQLRQFVETISADLSLDSITDSICDTAFSLIGSKKGTCLLYLIDHNHQISLFKSKKEDASIVIKEKQGDMFDVWVVRHLGPLLVEDSKKDFRFDCEKMNMRRPVMSMVAAPMVSENKLVGVIRLESKDPGAFTQDDLRFLTALADVSAVAIENSQLYLKTRDLATHDGLTNLYTKGYFLDYLREECLRSQRSPHTFVLLMIDIDFFKKYNDKFGHSAGDIVLKQLSVTINACLKDYHPVVCRFGGEEFCVVLPDLSKDEALKASRMLRTAIEKNTIVLRRQETNVTVSIGLAAAPQDGDVPEDLIHKADKALYDAKQQGRNKVVAC